MDLGDNLLRLEIVDAEPKVLPGEVAFLVFDALAEDQWALGAVVVLESDSLVDNSPSLVIGYHFIFSVSWNRALDFELE